jgi:hypothetical protein
MTPEERARDIGYCTCANIAGEHGEHCIVTQIAAAIRAAVEAERERCAKLAYVMGDKMESQTMNRFLWADDVADAIRARATAAALEDTHDAPATP